MPPATDQQDKSEENGDVQCEYIVRRGTEKDIETLAAFNCALAEETEDLHLDRERVTKGVTNVFLSGGQLGHYYVASPRDRPDQVVGQLMVTFEWSDWHNGQYWWIQSVYVDKEHRRRGVFSLLFNTVKSECETSGGKRLSLYVEHDNHRAQETYSRLGMNQSHYRLMQIDF